MRIEEIVLSAARKHNLGRYENVDFFCSLKIIPDSMDTPEFITQHIGAQFPVILEDLKRQFDEYERQRAQRFQRQAEQLIADAEQEHREEPPHKEVEPNHE